MIYIIKIYYNPNPKNYKNIIQNFYYNRKIKFNKLKLSKKKIKSLIKKIHIYKNKINKVIKKDQQF